MPDPRKSASKLELQFERLWSFYHEDCALEPELVFYPGRKWRLDFAHPGAKVGVEIHGAIFAQGRHNRGKGMQADAEKFNHAAMDGWAIFTLAGKEMISREWIDRIRQTIDSRLEAI